MDSLTNRKIYKIVNESPQYKGGENAMDKIIYENLNWPQEGCNFHGTLYVEFIIEADGHITGLKIKRGADLGGGCNVNEKALKAVGKLTEWIPGKCHGKEVPFRYLVPVRFQDN
jgi:hypothetical protein